MPRTAVYSLTAAHADALQRLASDPAIAATSRLPHPYPAGAAREFIDRLLACRAEGTGYGFVVMDQGNVVGLCTLDDVRGGEGRLGGWIGRPFQGRGFGSFGARMLLEFGFLNLQLARVSARVMESNAAARRVLEKLGFEFQGTEPGAPDRPAHSDIPDAVYEIRRQRWNAVRHSPALARFHPALRVILDAELDAGNEVIESSTGWPEPDSVFVRLKQPFLSTPPPSSEVEYAESNDPHWWKAEYRSRAPRHLLVY